MIGAATPQIESEAPLGDFAAEQVVANLQMVQLRSEFALRHELDEKLEALFVRRRNNGVGAFNAFAFVVNAQSSVLPCLEGKWPAGIDADQPQIFRQIPSLDHARSEMLVRRQSQ